MKEKFTLPERLVSGAYCALVATLSLVMMLQEPQVLISALLGGFFSGAFVTPAILIPNKFLVIRAIAAGCLTTLATTFFAAFFVSVILAFNLDAPGISWESLTPINIKEALHGFLLIALMGAILALPYSIIGSIAMVVFSYLLSKHRNRHPELAPDIFD